MTSTDVAPVKNNPLSLFRDRLRARRAEIEAALPPDITYAQFERAATTGMQLNPTIMDCTFASIWTALLRSCRDGLLPDGQEGAIVPYNKIAQWQPMAEGKV